MRTIFRNARVFHTAERQFSSGEVAVEGSKIVAVAEKIIPQPGDETFDCKGLFLIPGLVDVHTHARIGTDFLEADETKLRGMLHSYAADGTTTVMATLASATYEGWLRTIGIVNRVRASEGADEARMPGIHFEGRYLSEAKRGAHAKELLVLPSLVELAQMTEITRGEAVHYSLAPELDGAEAFIRKAVKNGATVGIAHTNCTYEQACDALSWGARSFTHTFNAMSSLMHRMPGCAGAALDRDDAYAELICDGVHTHEMIPRLLYKCKPKDKLVLITDSMQATGYGDGVFNVGGIPVTVKNGIALNNEGALAGSTLTLFRGVTNFMRFTGASFEDTIPCATENPARMVGIYDSVGEIAPGKTADFLLVADKIAPELKKVILRGKAL